MPDLTQNNIKWIAGFTKDQFDVLVREFIKSYWGIAEVVYTDGTGDGGIDFKCFEGQKHNKIPIQVTVEKKVYKKLEDDLEKISKAIQDREYLPELHFFYSHGISESTIDDLKIKARREYGITLEIYDAKRIGSIAGDSHYPELQRVIRQLLGDAFVDGKMPVTDFEKMRFDLLAFGDDTLEIKNNIIRSYILFNIFENEAKPYGLLVTETVEYFGNGIDNGIVNRQIEFLRSSGKLEILNEPSKTIKLLDTERTRIDKIREDLSFQEQIFVHEIGELLAEYNLNEDKEQVINEIIDLYKKCYKRDLEEMSDRTSDEQQDVNATKEFKKFIEGKTGDKDQSTKIVESLLEACAFNDYIQRIAAGEVFCNFSKADMVTQYIRRQPKPVYLDTTILIQILCYFTYNSHSWQDRVYLSSVDLYEYSKSGAIRIELFTSKQYVRECAYQLLHAFKLAPLTNLPIFNEMGNATSNAFYRFYYNVKGESDFESFPDFLDQFEFENYDSDDNKTLELVAEQLEDIFETNHIRIDDLSNNEFHRDVRRHFEDIKKDLEIIHGKPETYRPPIAIKNDALMLTELFYSMKNVEPTFITWDKSFHEVRKDYLSKHRKATFWHLYRPAKFLDHITLINFNIDPSFLSKDILTLLDEDFNIQEKVRNIADILSRILNLRNENGINLAKEINKIRKEFTYKINKSELHPIGVEYKLPVDEVLIGLNDYYNKKSGKYTFSDFFKTVNNTAFSDKVIDIIRTGAEGLSQNLKKIEEVIDAMNNLINQNLITRIQDEPDQK